MDAINTRQSGSEGAGLPGSRAEFITMIASLMAINAIAIDIMLPALPDMGASLGVASENARQYVLTSYFLGFGLAQLVFGPLADRFGRKLPLQVGMGIYVVAAVAAIMVTDFDMLLAARFVQGVGAASTRVLAVAIVRDLFGGRRMAEVMSLVMMVFMAAPVIAPAAGQIIILVADWHMIFLFMAVTCAAIMLWVGLRLPETLPVDRRAPLAPGKVAMAFITVVTDRISFCYALATMVVFGSLFGFIAAAQQIYVGIYGLGVWFPVAFAIIAGVMAASSYVNSRLVQRFGMRRLSHGALIAYAVATLAWWLLSLWAGPLSFWLFMVLQSVIFFFFGWIGSNFNAMAMEPLGAIAGTGSAVVGFLQTAGGSLVGALIGQSFDGTDTPMALGFLIVSLAAIVLVLIAERGRLFQAQHEQD